MSCPYHTLLSRQKGSHGTQDKWSIEFGDYSYRVVAQERRDALEGANGEREFTIITTGDEQAAINAAVAELNKEIA